MHGAFSLSTSGEPLLDGFRVLYGSGAAKTLAFLAVIGLIASFHTIIYAYGRQIYSLARAGYYLPFMSLTNDKKVPHMALYVGTALGFATMMILWYRARLGEGRRDHRLDAAQHGGVRRDDLVRDAGTVVHPAAQEHAEHRAAVSQPGRACPARSSRSSLRWSLSTTSCRIRCTRRPCYAVAAFYVLGILYFALYGRNQLILSPEEEFALSKGEKAHG